MSATMFAGLIVTLIAAGGLAVLAVAMVWGNRRATDGLPVGLAATCLGAFAVLVFSVGVSMFGPVSPPDPPRCAAGTFDLNGGTKSYAECEPYPASGRS